MFWEYISFWRTRSSDSQIIELSWIIRCRIFVTRHLVVNCNFVSWLLQLSCSQSCSWFHCGFGVYIFALFSVLIGTLGTFVLRCSLVDILKVRQLGSYGLFACLQWTKVIYLQEVAVNFLSHFLIAGSTCLISYEVSPLLLHWYMTSDVARVYEKANPHLHTDVWYSCYVVVVVVCVCVCFFLLWTCLLHPAALVKSLWIRTLFTLFNSCIAWLWVVWICFWCLIGSL
jgi:hypothetical protein